MNTLEKIVPAPGITVWTDENGVTREYREVKRKANVGELIKVNVTNGFTRVVDHICRVVENQPGFDWWLEYDVETDGQWDDGSPLYLLHRDYVVLEPTDIIHYNGKRYRETHKQAHVGDVVLWKGQLWKVQQVYNGTFSRDIKLEHMKDGRLQWIGNCSGSYKTLEPVSDDEQSEHQPLESRLAALEQRVAELERKLQIREIANSIMDRNEAAFQKLADSYTRAEVIELAKRDVEELLYKNYPKAGFDGWGIWLSEENGYVVTDVVRFIVNRPKRTVVALVHTLDFPHEIRARGKAKCAPGDCFNIHIGKAIALRRALGLDVPNYYLNAPQPTDAQVGDIVEWRGSPGIQFVLKRKTGKVNFDIECVNTCSPALVKRGAKLNDWPVYAHETVVIDDSHDFGGDAV